MVKEATKLVVLAFVGLTKVTGGKVGVVLRLVKKTKGEGNVAEAKLSGERLIYKGNRRFLNNFGRPGSLWLAELKGKEETLLTSSLKFSGQWHVEADRVRWQAEYDAFQTVQAAEKAERLVKRDNAVREALATLHEAYERCPTWKQRSALLAVAITHITG